MIELQYLTAYDVKRTYQWLQDDDLRSRFKMLSKPTRRQHFLHWRKSKLDSSQRAYAIYYDGKHVGNCGLKNFDTDNSYCELWIYIGEITMRGRGIAKYAVQKLKTLAKDEFKFNSIYLHVDKKNHVAKCLYTANGFEEVVERLMPPWQSLENDVLKMVCNLCDAQ